MINRSYKSITRQLKPRESLLLGMSSLILIFCFLVFLCCYVIAPSLTGRPWKILSPSTISLLTMIGVLFLGIGIKRVFVVAAKKLDSRFEAHFFYRMIRGLALALLSALSAVASIIFFAWIQAPKHSRREPEQRERGADDIWDGSPQHYYDNDVPPPFK